MFASSDLRKLGLNLVPFPRVSGFKAVFLIYNLTKIQLHFLMPSYAPFYNPQDKAFLRMSVADLTQAWVSATKPPQLY